MLTLVRGKAKHASGYHPGQRDFPHTSVFNELGAKESQLIQSTQL